VMIGRGQIDILGQARASSFNINNNNNNKFVDVERALFLCVRRIVVSLYIFMCFDVCCA
jgi:hypothetical protein